MHTFTVWAPSADRIDVEVHVDDGARRVPMARTDDGWW